MFLLPFSYLFPAGTIPPSHLIQCVVFRLTRGLIPLL
jgi:hypothetical protein